MLPGILVSALAITVLVYQIDLRATWEALVQIKLWRVAAALFVLFVAFVVRTLGWRVLLQGQTPFSESFSAIGIGYLFNQVLPFRLGEVARTLVLSMRTRLSFWEVFPTVVVERIFDLGFLALLLFSTLPFVVGAEWAVTAAVIAAVLVVVGFAVLYGMVFNPGWVQGVYAWIAGRLPRVRSFGEEKIDLFLRGLSVLRKPRRFFAVFGWIGLTWILSLLWNSIVLAGFYPGATLLEVGFIVGLAAVGVAAPSTPGNLGVYEAAIWSAFLALSADPAQGLAFALATHGMYILMVVILGVGGLLYTRISLRLVYNQARTRQT